MPNSYDVIVKNIHSLCRKITNVSMVVRINYTPDNIDRAMTILDALIMISVIRYRYLRISYGRKLMKTK